MIKSQIINANEFLYYSIIKIILMTMTLYKENQLNDIIILFRIILNQINTYKHYYIYIILKVFQKYNKKNNPKQNTINAICEKANHGKNIIDFQLIKINYRKKIF